MITGTCTHLPNSCNFIQKMGSNWVVRNFFNIMQHLQKCMFHVDNYRCSKSEIFIWETFFLFLPEKVFQRCKIAFLPQTAYSLPTHTTGNGNKLICLVLVDLSFKTKLFQHQKIFICKKVKKNIFSKIACSNTPYRSDNSIISEYLCK